MAAKNIVAKAWSLTASFDGLKYSAYPTGNKPSGFQSTPTLISTDIISGSLTGGENNKGAYLRLYGYNLGRQALLGTSTGAKVFMRDPLGDNTWHEVDNYRSLGLSKVYLTHQIVELICQVGSLGGSQVLGRALDVKITVNGVDTNILAGQFTTQPGRFWFVDNVHGNDSTGRVDDITKPFRYAQFAVGGANSYTGIWATTTAMGDTGLRAGDTVILRDNPGTPYTDNSGFDNRFIRFRSHTGTVPNGTIGNGYIHFTAYPGPILGNAPESPLYADPPGGHGCILGVNSAYAGTYGQYWSISGWRMTCDASSASDSGMVNLQYGANNTRIYSCEMGPWPSTLVTPGNAKSGGIAGDGTGITVMFNYIHDVECDKNNPASSANENHLIYFDGGSNGGSYNQCAKNVEVAYNRLENTVPLQTGGSGIQFYNSSASGTNANFTGINVHHNFVRNIVKYGINFADYFQQGNCWGNVVVTTGAGAFRMNTSQSGCAIIVSHNLFYDNNTSGAGPAQGAVNNDNNIGSGSTINITHNSIVLNPNRGAGRSSNDFVSNNASGTLTLTSNHYYDGSSVRTAPASDTTAVTGDPKWTSATPVYPADFTVQAGSPLLGACSDAELLAIAVDFFGMARPVTNTSAPGGTKNDIGPFQGVGV